MTEAHSRHPRRKIQGKIQRELPDAWPICETLEHAFFIFLESTLKLCTGTQYITKFGESLSSKATWSPWFPE